MSTKFGKTALVHDGYWCNFYDYVSEFTASQYSGQFKSILATFEIFVKIRLFGRHTVLLNISITPFHVLHTGCGQNPARQAAMAAGVPKEVPSTTINMVCGSGLRAVAMGYQAIRCGDASVVVAGGQESMSQVSQYIIV